MVRATSILRVPREQWPFLADVAREQGLSPGQEVGMEDTLRLFQSGIPQYHKDTSLGKGLQPPQRGWSLLCSHLSRGESSLGQCCLGLRGSAVETPYQHHKGL